MRAAIIVAEQLGGALHGRTPPDGSEKQQKKREEMQDFEHFYCVFYFFDKITVG